MWSLCFNVHPFSFKNKNRNGSQRYCGLLSWSCFSKWFPRSSVFFSLVSIDSVTYWSTPFTIPNQEAVLSWNRDGTLTPILYRSSRPQTFMFKTGPILVFFRIHPVTRVFFSFRGIVCSRHKCCISCPSVSREGLSCFDKLSSPYQNILWIISGLLTIVQFSLTLAPFFSVDVQLVWVSSAEGRTGISIVSKWSGAASFSGAVRSLGNSLHRSSTAPWTLSWFSEITVRRSKSMFSSLPLKCEDFLPWSSQFSSLKGTGVTK